ncbi:MAG: hypothetical protein LBI27_07485, partial [Clostridiales bacterium]|nr:hypothetical protein [Clostridiales bacterium]
MYYVIFGVGAGFIILSFLIGELGELGDFGDVGETGTGGGSVLAFLKPSLISVFLVVMGGCGLLLTPTLTMNGAFGIILFISFCAGLVAAAAVNRFV